MSTFVIAVFLDELEAAQGVHALTQLHAEGSITLYDALVVQRQPDGTLATKQREPTPAVATGISAVLGALFGLFGGPVSLVVPGEVSDELLEDVADEMQPGDYAVLAEVSEPWTALIDTRMRALGATVLREQRSDVVDDLLARRAQAHRAAIEGSVGDARERLQRIADKAHQRLEDTRRELRQKLIALDDQAKKAMPEVRRQIEQRIAEIRSDFGERERKLSQAFQAARQTLQS